MRINPGLDEGQSGDQRELMLGDLRGEIRSLISWPDGSPSWMLAHEMGNAQVPTMAAATIINFAFGHTKRPSAWTIRVLTRVAGYEMVLVPNGAKLPKGSLKL